MVRRALIIVIVSRRQCILGLLLLLAIIMTTAGSLAFLPVMGTNPLAGKVIAVDPGHGGIDGGSSHGSLREKNVTLTLSRILAKELQSQGATVVLTRNSDTDLFDGISVEREISISKEEYLQDRQAGRKTHSLDRAVAQGTRIPPPYRLGLRTRLIIASQHQADLLVSIHTNKYRSPSARGSATLHQINSPASKRLAQAIQTHLGHLVPGRAQPDVIPDDFFLLRRSPIPAVIVEVGFISNARDREFMLSAEGAEAIAKAITKGLRDYFGNGLRQKLSVLFSSLPNLFAPPSVFSPWETIGGPDRSPQFTCLQ